MVWGQETGDGMLGHTFGGALYVQPTEWWVQLHYGQPGPEGTDNAWTEAGRRQAEFLSIGSGTAWSDDDVIWESLPNPNENDEIQFCTIWDQEEGGRCLDIQELTQTYGGYATVKAGQRFKIPVNQLVVMWKDDTEEESSSSLSSLSSSSSQSNSSSSSLLSQSSSLSNSSSSSSMSWSEP